MVEEGFELIYENAVKDYNRMLIRNMATLTNKDLFIKELGDLAIEVNRRNNLKVIIRINYYI